MHTDWPGYTTAPGPLTEDDVMRAINDRDEPRNEREAALQIDEQVNRRAAFGGARSVWPSCSGPCSQGRKVCPTPAACRLGDDDFESADSEVLLMLAAVAVAIIFGLAAFVIVIK